MLGALENEAGLNMKERQVDNGNIPNLCQEDQESQFLMSGPSPFT